jgi:peptide deformylase
MSVELLAPPVFPPELVPWSQPVPEDWPLPSVGDVAVFRRESGLFVPPGSEVLRESARSVSELTVVSGGLERVVGIMSEAAGVGSQRSLVGIAAPQVGEPYRLIGVKLQLGESDEITWLHDPVVIDRSDDMYLDGEVCFSCYKVSSGFVPRYRSITIDAANLDKPRTFTDTPGERSGIVARIIQHELDHLDGLRFPDRLIEHMGAGRLCEHVMSWTYTEHSTGYNDVPRDGQPNFPPDRKSPRMHHAQMMRTGQTRQPWQPVLKPVHWRAIKHNVISIPTGELAT